MKMKIIYTLTFALALAACQPNRPVNSSNGQGAVPPASPLNPTAEKKEATQVPKEESIDDPSSSDKQDLVPLISMTWKTMGGGNMEYTITKSTVGSDVVFDIHVTDYNFSPADEHIELSKKQSAKLTNRLRILFDGALKIEETKATPGLMTGTWRSVTLVNANHESQEISDPRILNPGLENLFSELRTWVGERVEKKSKNTEKNVSYDACDDIDLSGTWTDEPETSGIMYPSHTISTFERSGKLIASDQIVHYSGLDKKYSGGCFGSFSDTVPMSYVFYPLLCRIEQRAPGNVITTFKITSLRKSASKVVRMGISTCNDIECLSVSNTPKSLRKIGNRSNF